MNNLSVLQIMKMIERYKLDFTKSYSYRGITCQVETNSEDHLDWASHYFKPYYDFDVEFETVYNIYTVADSDLYNNTLKELASYSPKTISSHHYQTAQEFDIEDDLKLILDQRSVFFIITQLSQKKFWLVTDGNDPDTKYETARIIREIFTRELEKQGFFLLHAAVVEKDGKAYVLCGEKGAGKTTSFLRLLEYGYNIIANDKIFIGFEEGKIRVIGWPGAVAITLQTMLAFERLKNILPRIRNMRFPQWRLSKEIDLSNISKIQADDCKNKVDLTVIETAELYNVQVKGEVVLDKIIFLSADKNNTTEIQKVSSERANSLLKSNFKYPEDSSYPDWFKMRKKEDIITKIFEKTVLRIIEGVSIYIFLGERVIEKDILAIHNLLQDGD